MTNWSVTVYDSIATAKTAYELIENTVYATITPFTDGAMCTAQYRGWLE